MKTLGPVERDDDDDDYDACHELLSRLYSTPDEMGWSDMEWDGLGRNRMEWNLCRSVGWLELRMRLFF